MTPCWGCGRPARGFGHLDLRRRIADPRRTPYRWAFCSTTCQDAFHQLYATRARTNPGAVEELLPVPHPLSHEAQRACLSALAQVAERVGFDVPLAQYSQVQATEVIEAVTMAYEKTLREQTDPRNKPMPPTLDPDRPFDDPIPF